MKLYSVVATTYNDAKEIETFLYDMLHQSLLPDEVVICDGGSNDNTIELIESFKNNNKNICINIVTGGRLNVSEGYNLAIKKCKNDLIGITGVGNRYDKFFFSKLLKTYNDNEGTRIVYAPIRGFVSGSFSQKYIDTLLNGEKGSRLAIASNHGALVERTVFSELGYFYEKFIYAGEDAEFYYLAHSKDVKSIRCDDAFLYWRVPDSWKEFRKQKKNYAIAELQIFGKRVIVLRLLKRVSPGLVLIPVIIISPRVGVGLTFAYALYLLSK